MTYTRRDLGRLALGALPAALIGWPARPRAAAQLAAPDSRVAGVQIGLNVPYNFGDNYMGADEVLARCVTLGVSAIELRSQAVEGFLGIPADLLAASQSRRGDGASDPARRQAALGGLRAWRVSVPMDRVRAFRRWYEDAGVAIEIVKFDGMYSRADDEVDYCFDLARNLGARAVSCEIDVPETRRIGEFAERHRMMVGYHGHTETGPAEWEEAFGYSRYNGANVDIGHFVAGRNTSPVPFITQHHDRITHIHVKDRKMNSGPNVPFGEGDTPIPEVLQLIRDNGWNIQATIEFEYPIPEGSDRMTEMARCVAYCRDALG